MTDEQQKQPERSGIAGLKPVDTEAEAYDASRDPRTGRPPNPLEAQRLAREHEQARLAEADEESLSADSGMARAEGLAEENGPAGSPVPAGQAPARMTPLKPNEDEKAAIDALVQEGVTPEHAEELVQTHGTNWETLKAAAFAKENMETSDGQQSEGT